MSVTIKDVAKLCGVSVSTVSRVLNGYTDISEETAKKVYEAIRKLDFVPSNTARMLSKKATRIVGLTIPDIKDPFFSENAAGAEKLLQENGYQIFYKNMERSADKLLNFLQQARQMRFDGLIITPDAWTTELLNTIEKLPIPMVSLRRRPPQNCRVPFVDNDHYTKSGLISWAWKFPPPSRSWRPCCGRSRRTTATATATRTTKSP